jgi:hypothetical protein
MTQQNRFKQNEEKIISRVEEMRQAGKISDEQARQMIQVGQQQANSPQSMQDMLAGEHAFKQRQSQMARQQAGGMPTGSGEGLAPDIGNRRATGQPGEVPFQSALRNFSFLNASAPNRASGSMQVGLPPGVNPQEAQNIQNLGGGGGLPPITAPPVDIQMDKGFTPWQGGKTPMQGNVGQPLPTLQQQSQEYLRNEGILDREMANRPKAGPSDNPIIGGLRSAGRSAGGYMKSLFDDPSRMAMLRGGLSMMDPNTYYDKQGFGSVFTGLNKGLGAAQKGHAGVLARRKAVADTAKAKAEAAYARGGKAGKNKAEFERVLEEYLTLPDGSERKPMLKRRLDTLAPEPGTGGVDYNYKEMTGYTWKELVPKSDEMQTSLTNFANLINSTVDSPLGITFGPGTDFKAHAYAVLSETFGQDMGEEGARLANTRQFMSAMGAQVAAAITAFGAGTGLSDADREFAKQMVGANPGDFTEASLRKLLIYNEGAMRGKLVAHNQRLKAMYGGTPPAGTLRKLPAMSKNLKRHMVEQMRKGDYTIGGEDVDPNKKPEGWTDEYPNQWKLLALKSAKKTAGNPTENRITKVNKR